MPVYYLIDQYVSPPPDHAENEGLLAVGGDLSPERLLLAYSSGIFPWFNEGDPICWWCPDPRCILELHQLRVSQSMTRLLRKGGFEVTYDRAFREVISSCAQIRRKEGGGTWITDEMLEAYCRLHELGYAHSVECWREGALAGGLYGVCMGMCFFGESMFSRESNASKVAFITLVRQLKKMNFELIDCQMPSSHLISLGAREISREEFLLRLRKGGVVPSVRPEPGNFPV